jgi:hypothetical protein
LRDYGFNVISRRQHPKVTDGVNAVNKMWRDGTMTAEPSCKEIVADSERTIWGNNGQIKKDAERSHMTEALTRPVEYLFPINRGFVGTIQR